MRISRLSPRVGHLAATVALALALTSCGGDSDEVAAPSSTASPTLTTEPAPSVTPSESATVDPADLPTIDPDTGEIDFCTDETKPFTGEAAKFFGADEVLQAYCSMVSFSLTRGMSSPMILRDNFPADYPPQLFSSVERFMTADLLEDWRSNVNDLENQAVAVYNLVMFGVSVGGEGDMVYSVVDDGQPFTTGGVASPARTELRYNDDGQARLVLRFTLTADIITTGTDGKNYHLPVVRDLNYTLAPTGNPEMPWLIDGYNTTTSFPEIPTKPSPRIESPNL